jgi:hypothetical protein
MSAGECATGADARRERLAKLLRLAARGLPHEAASALAKARRLAEVLGVALTGTDCPELDRVLWTERRNSPELSHAAAIIMEFFHARAAWLEEEEVPHTFEDTQWVLRARGAPEALDFAGYIVAFLIRHWRFCWDHRRGRAKPGARGDFMRGLYQGIWSMLDEERRAGDATPPVEEEPLTEEDLERLMEEAARQPKRRAPAAWLHGFALGRETRIRKPLGGEAGGVKSIK